MSHRRGNLNNLLSLVSPWVNTNLVNAPLDNLLISGIAADSKKCRPNFLFVAVKGATAASRNGDDFIDEAVDNGATAVVVEESFSAKNPIVPLFKTRDSRLFLSHIAEAFYDFPSHKLKLVGITGTNGKTSTTFMVHNILQAAGLKPKIMGTLGMGDPLNLTPLTHTTMDPLFISEQLAAMVDEKISHVIMEISSHALSLKRTDALSFATVALTNITQDHLDFHKTLADYTRAKARLFFELASLKTKIVLPRHHPFGDSIKDLRNLSFFDGSEEASWDLPLFGDFHRENAQLAKKIAESFFVSDEDIAKGLSTCPNIPGRLEAIAKNGQPKIFIDYAHTPHALLSVLSVIKKMPHHRIILVFGCGGDRDQQKRPLMGNIAKTLADVVIVTDDNPRNEDPTLIRKQILAGISHTDNTLEIKNRSEAIRVAIENAEKNDIVVIAGKGHENYQIYGHDRRYFSDREEAQKVLDSL